MSTAVWATQKFHNIQCHNRDIQATNQGIHQIIAAIIVPPKEAPRNLLNWLSSGLRNEVSNDHSHHTET